jgi:hypothetical protein
MTRTRSALVYASVAYLAGILLLCAIAMTLGGCAGGLQGSPTVASQRMVYSAETDFAAALRIAVAYESLPVCGTHTTPCADPQVVAKVTAAAKTARASLSTAEAAVRSSSNQAAITTAALQAQQDVSVFTALADALGGK